MYRLHYAEKYNALRMYDLVRSFVLYSKLDQIDGECFDILEISKILQRIRPKLAMILR